MFVPLHEEGHAHILSIGASGELMQLCNHNGRSVWLIYDGHRSIEPTTDVLLVEFSDAAAIHSLVNTALG